MKFVKILPLILIGSFFFFSLFSVRPAHAQLGDVDGDGNVTPGDAAYLINYLFSTGAAPVVRNNADVDNCPGVNLGDAYQILHYLYHAGQLFPPVGTDLIVPSDIKITTGFVRGTVAGQIITLDVKINTVGQPDLIGVVIPLSYADLPGETQLICNNVDFTGTLLSTSGSFSIDPFNRTVVICAPGSGTPVIPTGSNGVIARIEFQVVTPGTHNEILPTYFPPENTILLISQFGYQAGDPPARMLLPKFYTSEVCDANGDNQLNLPDIVYLINFLFMGGPPPINGP